MHCPDSIHIHYTDGVIPYELGKLASTQKLHRHLLSELPLHRRTDHSRGSIRPRHPRHLLTQPQLRNRHRQGRNRHYRRI